MCDLHPAYDEIKECIIKYCFDYCTELLNDGLIESYTIWVGKPEGLLHIKDKHPESVMIKAVNKNYNDITIALRIEGCKNAIDRYLWLQRYFVSPLMQIM